MGENRNKWLAAGLSLLFGGHEGPMPEPKQPDTVVDVRHKETEPATVDQTFREIRKNSPHTVSADTSLTAAVETQPDGGVVPDMADGPDQGMDFAVWNANDIKKGLEEKYGKIIDVECNGNYCSVRRLTTGAEIITIEVDDRGRASIKFVMEENLPLGESKPSVYSYIEYDAEETQLPHILYDVGKFLGDEVGPKIEMPSEEREDDGRGARGSIVDDATEKALKALKETPPTGIPPRDGDNTTTEAEATRANGEVVPNTETEELPPNEDGGTKKEEAVSEQ